MSDILFWQIFIRVSIKFYTYQDCLDIYILLIQTCRIFVKVEMNKVLRESSEEDCHLVEGFEIAWVGVRRFERVGCTKFLRKSSIFFANSWNFSHMFLTPRYTLGTKEPKKPTTKTAKTTALFQKICWKRVKEDSFNLKAERGIVGYRVVVIWTPQLTP